MISVLIIQSSKNIVWQKTTTVKTALLFHVSSGEQSCFYYRWYIVFAIRISITTCKFCIGHSKLNLAILIQTVDSQVYLLVVIGLLAALLASLLASYVVLLFTKKGF